MKPFWGSQLSNQLHKYDNEQPSLIYLPIPSQQIFLVMNLELAQIFKSVGQPIQTEGISVNGFPIFFVCFKLCYQMTQLKSSGNPEPEPQQKLGQEVLHDTLKIEAQSAGVLQNFVTVVSEKSRELYHNIMGDYGYIPKNQFSFNQKQKILGYLESKMFTDNVRLQQLQKVKFTDYDEHFLDVLPSDIDALRNKILKARTNLQAAEKSYERVQHSRDQITVKYLNEQAYEFDKTKYNSVAWGFVLASFINCTFYKHGSTIRKAALFATFGHIFGIISYFKNIDRYFDSVYPIFQKDALIYASQQKIAFKNWKPQGQAIIEN